MVTLSTDLTPLLGFYLAVARRHYRYADAMGVIGQFREARKSGGETPAELEEFHHAEPHPYFNESYYFNGATMENQDRVITRISRRGVGASWSKLGRGSTGTRLPDSYEL